MPASGYTLGEVTPDARRIVERWDSEHPYRFKSGEETRIEDIEKRVVKLEKNLDSLVEKRK